MPFSVWKKVGGGVWSMIDIQDGILKHWRDWDDLEVQDYIYHSGLMSGYKDGTFRPDSIVTRREVSAAMEKIGIKHKSITSDKTVTKVWLKAYFGLEIPGAYHDLVTRRELANLLYERR